MQVVQLHLFFLTYGQNPAVSMVLPLVCWGLWMLERNIRAVVTVTMMMLITGTDTNSLQ